MDLLKRYSQVLSLKLNQLQMMNLNSSFQMMHNLDNFYIYGIITKVKMIMKTQTTIQMKITNWIPSNNSNDNSRDN